jgi:hypothetical protein
MIQRHMVLAVGILLGLNFSSVIGDSFDQTAADEAMRKLSEKQAARAATKPPQTTQPATQPSTHPTNPEPVDESERELQIRVDIAHEKMKEAERRYNDAKEASKRTDDLVASRQKGGHSESMIKAARDGQTRAHATLAKAHDDYSSKIAEHRAAGTELHFFRLKKADREKAERRQIAEARKRDEEQQRQRVLRVKVEDERKRWLSLTPEQQKDRRARIENRNNELKLLSDAYLERIQNLTDDLRRCAWDEPFRSGAALAEQLQLIGLRMSSSDFLRSIQQVRGSFIRPDSIRILDALENNVRDYASRREKLLESIPWPTTVPTE